MTELPKADRFFKQIVDRKAQQYIKKSQEIADQYMKQRQSARENAKGSLKYLNQLKRQIKILKNIQISGIQVSGTSIQQVRELISKYQNIVENTENSLEFQQKDEVNLAQQTNQQERKEELQMEDSQLVINQANQTQDNYLYKYQNGYNVEDQLYRKQSNDQSLSQIRMNQSYQSNPYNKKYMLSQDKPSQFMIEDKNRLQMLQRVQIGSSNKKKIIGYALKIFQFFTTVLMLIVMLKVLFFV